MPTTTFDLPCRISVEQSPETFHAYVELAGDVPIYPGDKVLIHGAPIRVEFGQRATYERDATVTRAGPLTRAAVKFASYFDFAELIEVSFSAGRLK